MIIYSGDGSHKATVEPTPAKDGAWVTLVRVVKPEHHYGTWFLIGPLHVVLDKMADIVWPMTKQDDRSTLVWDAELRRVVRTRRYSRSKPCR